MEQKKCIVYVGDFDLRNENVQSHLVKNNAAILRALGYEVAFAGICRNCSSFEEVAALPPLEGLRYLELPYTLTTKGLLQRGKVAARLTAWLEELHQSIPVAALISYQAPTYAGVLAKLISWCKRTGAKYLVNCADLPVFDSQPLVRRMVMKNNWGRMHRLNQRYAQGVIAVSQTICDFYAKEGRASMIVPPLFTDTVELPSQQGDKAVFLYAGTPFVTLDREVAPAGMKDRLDKVVDLFLALKEAGVSYRFVIVGLEKEVYTTCVPRHKQALASCGEIEFWGRRSHGETLRALVDADYMINYRDENLMTKAGYSTKVVESVSVGTPVVTNPVGDTFCYLEEGVSAYALTGDRDKDVALLTRLCRKSARERQENKRRCAEKRTFDPKQYEGTWQKFLKEAGITP